MSETEDGSPAERIRRNFQRWASEHPKDAEGALRMMKLSVSRSRTKRLDRMAFVRKMLPHVEEARRQLDEENCDRTNGSKRIADRLNARGFRTQTFRWWTHSQVYELFTIVNATVTHCVMECRTKMTAQLLSADFVGDGELEQECIREITEALKIARQLEGLADLIPEVLSKQARELAVSEAKRQREYDYFPMLARECLISEADAAQLVAMGFEELPESANTSK